MNVVVTKSYDESCAYVADMICKLVNEKPDCQLGLATGGTPVPMYKKLIEANKAGKVDFSKVRTVNLDEYCGIPETHDQSYRYFMNTNLFDHINIDKANTYVAQGMGDPEANAAALEAKVREGGVADLQLLGIGNNGHIAFNEAADQLVAVAHTEPVSYTHLGDPAYYEKILANVKACLDGSNTIAGTFMCQGQMMPMVRARYEQQLAQNPANAAARGMLETFDRAVGHPDAADLAALCAAAHAAL